MTAAVAHRLTDSWRERLLAAVTPLSAGVRGLKVTGYRPEEALGRNPRLFKSGQTPRSVYDDMWQTITGGGIWTGRLYNRKKDGTLYWEVTVIAGITDEHGEIVSYVAIKVFEGRARQVPPLLWIGRVRVL